MINIGNFKQILIWVLFVAGQVILAQNAILFNKAFCFIYLGFILLLPFEISRINLMLIAIITGLVIDIFYNSLGTHMAAATFLAFVRPFWLNAITPRGGYENVESPSLKDLGSRWFLAYALPLVAIYLLIAFFIEAGGFHLFFHVIIKVLASTLFTTFVLVLIQYLFYAKGRYS